MSLEQPFADPEHVDVSAWLSAGDTLAEKAIAALDLGDEERASTLAHRIVGLPVVNGSARPGLMAVSVLLVNEVVDPTFDDGEARGLLDLPLRLLPTLDEHARPALLHALAVIADYDVPAAVLRRVREVTSLDARFDAPFAGVPEGDLPAAVLATLRLVLQLRSEG